MIGFSPQQLEYNTDLYVARPNLERIIVDWFADSNAKPILSLVGPPGTGKSWLMAHLPNLDLQPKPGFILSFDAVWLAEQSNHDEAKRQLIDAANVSCHGLNFPMDLTPPLGAIIEFLRQRLCARCSSQPPLILIDGCDDLPSHDVFSRFQEDLLLPFFGAGDKCFRMVIARRYDLTEYQLKMNSKPLLVNVFDNLEIAAPTQRDFPYGRLNRPSPASLRSVLPANNKYQWDHPLINSLLLQFHAHEIFLTSSILKDICLRVLNRPWRNLGIEENGVLIARLEELTRLATSTGKHWMGSDFERICNRRLNSTDLQNQIILYDRSIGKYKIADGFRELLQDLDSIRKKERDDRS